MRSTLKSNKFSSQTVAEGKDHASYFPNIADLDKDSSKRKIFFLASSPSGLFVAAGYVRCQLLSKMQMNSYLNMILSVQPRSLKFREQKTVRKEWTVDRIER